MMSGRQKTSKTKSASREASQSSTTSTPASAKAGREVDGSETRARRSSRSRMRSSSPLNISRTEEKDEIGYLNDRLASYIDYVRSLELAKEKLTKKITSVNESQQMEVTRIRDMFEDEIAALRKALDDAGRENSMLKVTARQCRAQCDDVKSESEKLRREVADLKKQLERARNQLERETVGRTDLENRIQTMKEELDFQARVHKEEVSKLQKQSLIITEEVTTRQKEQYESKLTEELRAFRNITTEELELHRQKLEEDFEEKFTNLQDRNAQLLDDTSRMRSELSALIVERDALRKEINQMTQKNAVLETKLANMHSLYEERIKEGKEREMLLRQELEDKISEFADLLSVKISLDQEIMAYRKLLESEESRCNLNPPDRETAFSYSSSDLFGLSKRPRVDLESGDEFSTDEAEDMSGEVTTATAAYTSNAQRNGDVSVEDVDTQGGLYVKIMSHSDNDISIGGWQLKYQADGNETVYKFNRNLILKPHETITIWSSESEQTHEPPQNLVMKGLKFFTGKKIDVHLVDADGSEQAIVSMEREESKVKRVLRTRSGRRRAYRRTGPASGKDEKCHIM